MAPSPRHPGHSPTTLRPGGGPVSRDVCRTTMLQIEEGKKRTFVNFWHAGDSHYATGQQGPFRAARARGPVRSYHIFVHAACTYSGRLPGVSSLLAGGRDERGVRARGWGFNPTAGNIAACLTLRRMLTRCFIASAPPWRRGTGSQDPCTDGRMGSHVSSSLTCVGGSHVRLLPRQPHMH